MYSENLRLAGRGGGGGQYIFLKKEKCMLNVDNKFTRTWNRGEVGFFLKRLVNGSLKKSVCVCVGGGEGDEGWSGVARWLRRAVLGSGGFIV